jgi:cytoskeletal protein CcmA (bactofilin family)
MQNDFNSLQGTRRTSTIGEDLTISGKITSQGEIHLDGHVQGDVQCVSVILGEGSQLEGGVIAEDVVVCGRLIGSVRALRVTLQCNSHVEGDIFHQSLAIEQGAFFEGESLRSEDPLSSDQLAALAPTEPELVGNGSKHQEGRPATVFAKSFPE